MKQVYIFLITGFEEIEALATIDILRRGGVDILSVSLTEEKTVTGSHRIPVVADRMFDEVDFGTAQMLILPGGTVKINGHDGLKDIILELSQKNVPIAAICAAPMVLGGIGLLKGKKATCYPGYEKYLAGAHVLNEPVVVDGNIITGRSAGYTVNFALELLSQLKGKEVLFEVANGILPK